MKFSLLVVLATATLAWSATPADVDAGKSLFRTTHCIICHGAHGDGNGAAAPAFEPPPMNLTNKQAMDRLTDADIVKHIKIGIPGTGMPSWEKRLSEAQTQQLVAYIRTLAH